MTMIRINLIAEKKAGASKAAKKPSGQQSEIQENFVLILFVVVSIALVAIIWNSVNNKLNEVRAENKRLTDEWKQVQGYQAEKEDYEIQKVLLSRKIAKISELKDLREGPVKLMEDVANALPESAWLKSIWQGYDRNLAQATRTEGTVIVPGPRKLGEPSLVMVTGQAKTADAVTNFTTRILNLDSRYYDTELNNYTQVEEEDGSKGYRFEIFFKVRQGKAREMEAKQ
jgi:Tfp pilus assembly protein PilN